MRAVQYNTCTVCGSLEDVSNLTSKRRTRGGSTMDTVLVSSRKAVTNEGSRSSGGRLGILRVKVRAWANAVRLSPRYDEGKERVSIGLSCAVATSRKLLH